MDLANLARLQTEAVNPRTARIDQLSTLEMCAAINHEDHNVAPSIAPCLPEIAAAIDALAPRVRRGGRVIYVGAGTSGRPGQCRLGILDASEIPPTFAADPAQFIGLIAGGDAAIRRAREGAEDSVSLAESDMVSQNLNPELDSLIGIAASGRTPYVLACLEFAKQLGCVTIGVVCADPSAIGQLGHVEFLIKPLPGPEVITGSTRLKAGTATKMVLNMLSTGTMIRIGKTFGNMMVDLVASNAKLHQRSRNILRRLSKHVATLSDTELDGLLVRCNQSVKLALLVAETGRPVEQCRRDLEVAGQRLAQALSLSNSNPQAEPPQRGGSPLVLCVDGGGTKCAAVIADHSGSVLGRGVVGPCNLSDGDCKGAMATLSAAIDIAIRDIDPALARSDVPLHFESAWIGLAGMDRPGLRDSLAAKIPLVLSASELRLTNDVDLLTATMSRHPNVRSAIVLIAGTGSVAMRYNAQQQPGTGAPTRVARSGGWGHLLGDEGGGYAIGREAIQHTLRAVEDTRLGLRGEPLGDLEQAVLGQFGLSSTEQPEPDLLSAILLGDPNNQRQDENVQSRIAAVAKLVLTLVPTDSTATAIASTQVSRLVETALGPLVDARCTRAVPFAETGLVLSGGVLTQGATYQRLLIEKMAEKGMRFAYVETVGDAGGVGAEYLASRLQDGQES
ncbi:hypothetical protein BJY01DRAFT_253762 [Aspergillus pseudoustus]|uniref:N-acetyl-D-glucosamine kinase n=1 Tax=Aspergillus pseudoustus TaxID=1810923 RepID=A0ABR4IYD4_9EURO